MIRSKVCGVESFLEKRSALLTCRVEFRGGDHDWAFRFDDMREDFCKSIENRLKIDRKFIQNLFKIDLYRTLARLRIRIFCVLLFKILFVSNSIS